MPAIPIDKKTVPRRAVVFYSVIATMNFPNDDQEEERNAFLLDKLRRNVGLFKEYLESARSQIEVPKIPEELYGGGLGGLERSYNKNLEQFIELGGHSHPLQDPAGLDFKVLDKGHEAGLILLWALGWPSNLEPSNVTKAIEKLASDLVPNRSKGTALSETSLWKVWKRFRRAAHYWAAFRLVGPSLYESISTEKFEAYLAIFLSWAEGIRLRAGEVEKAFKDRKSKSILEDPWYVEGVSPVPWKDVREVEFL